MISRTIAIGIKAAVAPKALDGKNKELIALGMAIYMGAGLSVMYASHAIDAFEQFSKPVSAPASTQA